MTTCSIGGCDKPMHSRGWCSMHYLRWLRHGDPLTTMYCTTCSIDDCTGIHYARGWCNSHYQRWKRHGDPLNVLIRPGGAGHITSKGYLVRRENGGVQKQEHVRIAERALGKPLPPGAQVHHVDENRLNNTPSNLVICPSNAYHALLHVRQRAMDATGDPNKRKCPICKQYDDVANMRLMGDRTYWHTQCKREYDKARRINKSAAARSATTGATS